MQTDGLYETAVTLVSATTIKYLMELRGLLPGLPNLKY